MHVKGEFNYHWAAKLPIVAKKYCLTSDSVFRAKPFRGAFVDITSSSYFKLLINKNWKINNIIINHQKTEKCQEGNNHNNPRTTSLVKCVNENNTNRGSGELGGATGTANPLSSKINKQVLYLHCTHNIKKSLKVMKAQEHTSIKIQM